MFSTVICLLSTDYSVSMPIQVTCPSCLKRFQVSDKFAGKSGPCPNCKKTLRVPDKSEEVVIHAPEEDGPKDSKGKTIVTPIMREEVDVTKKGLMITGGVVLAVLVIAVVVRFVFPDHVPVWLRILGILALAPPLVAAGYSFVREQELEPYQGEELRNRVLVLSGVFAILWMIYAFLPAYVMEYDSAANMSWMVFGITFCVMLGFGALASVAAFELEFFNGLAHAGLYLIGVVIIAAIAGVSLAGVEMEDRNRSRSNSPSSSQPKPAASVGETATWRYSELAIRSPHDARLNAS